MITVEEAKNKFQGVVVPLLTMFADDLSVDLEATASVVRWLIYRGARQGNTILLAVGSGGDFSVLSTEERKQTIHAIADANAGRLPIMASVQSTDIRVVIDLAQHCEEVGIDAVQIGGPFYYDGKPGDHLAWLQEVARHTGVGFAPYNHWYTGPKYDLPIDLVERMLDIPNSVAVKWATPDDAKFDEGVRRFLPRAAVVCNSFEMAIPSHKLGVRAWVSHVPNFYPEHSWRVWDLMEEGRYQEAEEVYDEFMAPYKELTGQIQAATAGEAIFVKAAMEAAGLRGGPSRLPSRDEAVTPEIREGFKKLLAGVQTPV
jgi:dihydrodipicolinate synthase/N-acetylneuraminate lyase